MLQAPTHCSMEFLCRQQNERKLLSPIFSVPGFGTECCKIDLLHAMHVGSSADFLGSLCYYIAMTKIRGSAKLKRCAALFQDISQYYEQRKIESRLPKLVPTVLRAEVNGKLKAPVQKSGV